MKNYCIVPVLIFLLLMLAYQCASAQDYVVTSKRDTLRGDVKPIPYGTEKKVQVTTSDKKKTILPITQTLAYTLKGETYHPVRKDNGYVFMKLIKPGYLSLYAYQVDNQQTYDGLYLLKRDGSRLEVPNINFKRGMSRFLEDCLAISQKIDKGDLNKKALHQIVDEYNGCIAGRTDETNKAIAQKQEQTKKISSWDTLEEKLKAEPDFDGKKDALDMIGEIKGKIGRSEKIPNFLLEGLKNSLAQSNLKAELESALKEIN